MQPHREPMAAVDTAWLRMEGDTNLMMIGVVLVFDAPLDLNRLRITVEERLLKFDRFRQRVVLEKEKAFWEDDPHFNLDNHIHRVALPGNADKVELQKFAGDLNSTPLDFNKPLWQLHVVENYNGGCAVMMRIHHCIADGISLVRVMLSLTDDEAEPALQKNLRKSHKEEGFFHHLLEPARGLINHTFHLGHELFEEGMEVIKHPSHLIDLAKEGASIGTELAQIGLLPSDPPTLLKRSLTGRKGVAWANPLSLQSVKTTAKALGGTINDVLLAAATGAIRRYLVEHDSEDVARDIHVAVPFNLRPLDKPIESLGNQFGLVVVGLPIAISDPLQSYHAVKTNMETLKNSHQAQIFYGMLGALGKGPSILEQTALEVLSKKASAVMTNVPGPKKTLFLAGSRLIQPMVWVPQSGEVGVGLSILSYNGTVQFGLVADENLVSFPEKVVDYFIESYQKLEEIAQKPKH